uniref:Uncharacterized protein n=1 Tax=Micrurus spixii TaxID=129469 RepID=A0A2D4LPL9_9SAUR
MYLSRICFLRKNHIIVVHGCQTQTPRWGSIRPILVYSCCFGPAYPMQRGKIKPAKLRPSLPAAKRKTSKASPRSAQCSEERSGQEAPMSRYNRQNLNPGLRKLEKSLQSQLLNQDVSSFRRKSEVSSGRESLC